MLRASPELRDGESAPRATRSTQEEVIVPFPNGSRDRVHVAQRFRSTWLSSSIRSLRERQLFDLYLTYLPSEYREVVVTSVVGVWLPIEVAIAHYRACDALRLPTVEIVSIGREATTYVHGTLLATFVRLAKGAGVTPWTVLSRIQELWDRIWMGGGVSVVKLGPKEARVEIAGWPCAASPYCRVAVRGVVPAIAELFSTKSYARDLPHLYGPTSVGIVLSWA
jgi:hypothetical protein